MAEARERTGVLHMTDTLEPGGMERVAVNLVNALPRDRFNVSLCTTRRDGPLSELVAPDVTRLSLARRHTLDAAALWKLRTFIKANDVRILHAHASALFAALAGSFCPPFPVIVWHDHCGHQQVAPRRVSLYRPAAARVSGVIAVNEYLADWSRTSLGVRPDRVWYIPNFVAEQRVTDDRPALPGTPGRRVVCVANLRPQKSHLDLLQAFTRVVRLAPDAHLLLVGREADAAYARSVREMISALDLGAHVSLLGERADVAAILRHCDVAVLSSVSEGFPLALVEYGLAGLPVVATDVGQCAEVLDDGTAGILVSAGQPAALADGIGELLRSPDRRRTLGPRLRQRVRERYGADAVIQQISHVYDTVARLSLAHA